MNIERDGVLYFIPKNVGEVNKVYFERVNRIIDEKPSNQKEIDKIKNKVQFDINKKYLGCEY